VALDCRLVKSRELPGSTKNGRVALHLIGIILKALSGFDLLFLVRKICCGAM
jgi:hypothetical protein